MSARHSFRLLTADNVLTWWENHAYSHCVGSFTDLPVRDRPISVERFINRTVGIGFMRSAPTSLVTAQTCYSSL